MQEMSAIKPRRSLLFIPANRPDRFDKALNSGADMVWQIGRRGGLCPERYGTQQYGGFLPNVLLVAYPEILVRINGLEEVEGVADLEAC